MLTALRRLFTRRRDPQAVRRAERQLDMLYLYERQRGLVVVDRLSMLADVDALARRDRAREGRR